MPESDDEIAFYRAVEELFASLRGVPHLLSPKDFQLMRGWWRDRVPLAAVASGITEVLARRRERGDQDPVVSLAYCRHAVRRHAQRLAEMHVGEAAAPEASAAAGERPATVSALAASLRAAADRLREPYPAVAAAVHRIAERLGATPPQPAALLEEHLFALEAVLLERCWEALPETERAAIAERSRAAADRARGSADTRQRTDRASRDRELRRLLALPRLELG